jgi:protease I
MRKIIGIVLIFLVAFAGPLSSFAQKHVSKKAVFIVAFENFQDDEFARPYSVLLQSGVSITVASTKLGEAVGTKGSKARVNMLLKDVKADDFDAVVFIGGPGAARYITDPVALKLVQDAVKKRKVVGAICIAPLVLAKAGVLKNKKATVFPTEADKLKEEAVKYTGKSVERDGKIITADGPNSATAFGQEIKKAL